MLILLKFLISPINKNPIRSESAVNQVMADLESSSFILSEVETKPQTSSPKSPFRTSTPANGSCKLFRFYCR